MAEQLINDNRQFKSRFIFISLRSVFGIVAAYVIAAVW